MIPLAPQPSPQLDAATAVVRTLQANGFVAYFAGGCVRDMALGRAPKDYDVATSATPGELLRIYPDAGAAGKAFAVVRVCHGDEVTEVATFRADGQYTDGRRPDNVRFVTPEEDAQRRDFTVNAMFYDPVAARLHDWVGGMDDLRARRIRCVGNPPERFREDHLRLLRAIRFATTLQFDLEPDTADAVRKNAALIRDVSAERVRDELTRTLTESPRPGEAVRQLDSLGLLALILPEVAAMKGVEQPPEFHPEGDVFAHTLDCLNLLERPSVELAWAVLLHDVGKPLTFERAPDRIRFTKHDEKGAALAGQVLERLKFSNNTIATVTRLIGEHMKPMHADEWRPSTVRKFVGADSFADALELHRVDCIASHGKLDNYECLRAYRAKYEADAREPALPPPWIDGHALIALGVRPGPVLGRWKSLAYDAQLDGRFPDADALRAWLIDEIRTHPDGPPAPPPTEAAP